MQEALMIMMEGRIGGLEGGNKYLILKPSKLLVRDDVRVVLDEVGHVEFLYIFYGYDVNITH